MKSAFADIVHTADYQRYRRQQLHHAEQREQDYHYNAEIVYLRRIASKTYDKKREQDNHNNRVAEHTPPELPPRRSAAVIERPRPEFIKTVFKFHNFNMNENAPRNSRGRRVASAEFFIA